MSIFGPGWSDYGCNTQGMMNGYQTYQADSMNQTDEYIQMFENAIANGCNPNDSAVQESIFSRGTLGYDDLLEEDKDRLIKAVENSYAMKGRK